MEANLRNFGSNLRKLRKGMGLSQEELAARSNLHRTYVGGIERGERNVSILNIFQLSKALCVAPADLFVDLRVRR